jgi:hypothetical protein
MSKLSVCRQLLDTFFWVLEEWALCTKLLTPLPTVGDVEISFPIHLSLPLELLSSQVFSITKQPQSTTGTLVICT